MLSITRLSSARIAGVAHGPSHELLETDDRKATDA